MLVHQTHKSLEFLTSRSSRCLVLGSTLESASDFKTSDTLQHVNSVPSMPVVPRTARTMFNPKEPFLIAWVDHMSRTSCEIMT